MKHLWLPYRVDDEHLFGAANVPRAFIGSLKSTAMNALNVLIAIAIAMSVLTNSASAVENDGAPPQSQSQSQSQLQQIQATKSGGRADDKLIEKANSLHEEATRLFDRNYFSAAINNELEAEKLVPTYWLPHAALGYMYFGRGGGALQEAEQSIKTEHPSFADTNLGQMFQYFRMFDEAVKAFKRVPEDDPQFPTAKVGIAACLMQLDKMEQGRKLLDEVYSSSPKNPQLLEALARAYFEIGEMNRAEELCRTALSSSPNPKAIDGLRKLILVAAVNVSDVSTVDSLKDAVRRTMEPYELGWLRAAEFKFANTPHDALAVLRFAETENTTDLQWLVNACVLKKKADSAAQGDKANWMQLEKACLEKCATVEPNNVDIRIMEAALEESFGQRKLALQKVQEGWISSPFDRGPNVIHANNKLARSDVSTLARSFIKEGNGYRSYISMIECKLSKVTCHCHYDRFKEAVHSAPGVISVAVGPGAAPTTLVLFDSRKASKRSIFESAPVVNLRENIEFGEEQPVKTITELGNLTADFVPPLNQPQFFFQRVALQFPYPDSSAQKSASKLTKL